MTIKPNYSAESPQQDMFPNSKRHRGEVLDSIPLKFGKYRGKSPAEIAEEDPGYLVWAYEKISPKPCSKALYLVCEISLNEMIDEAHEFMRDDSLIGGH